MSDRGLIMLGIVIGVVTLGVLVRVSYGDLTTQDVLVGSGFAAGVIFSYWLGRKDKL